MNAKQPFSCVDFGQKLNREIPDFPLTSTAIPWDGGAGASSVSRGGPALGSGMCWDRGCWWGRKRSRLGLLSDHASHEGRGRLFTGVSLVPRSCLTLGGCSKNIPQRRGLWSGDLLSDLLSWSGNRSHEGGKADRDLGFRPGPTCPKKGTLRLGEGK